MVNATVDKATSDMLIGPDWAMNIEICDICNNEPAQAKDVTKGIKKRLGSRNPKVQLLALTLLETIVKNCGDIVHMHVAQKDLPHEMVKIFKKKPDFHVKEKILILIDTWQEVFGGPRAKYPQYYAAYQELLRNGAVFPQKSDRSAPVFTPPQTQPLASYHQNLHNADSRPDAVESSVEAEFPTLSLTEMQNARGIVDVLAEMLNALDPGNIEGLKQEVIVDLVEQCRTYKQRVLHLVNSTSDESLLSQGLALNDDLQKVLSKHESIVSGTAFKTKQAMPEPVETPAHDPAPLIDTGNNKPEQRSSSSTLGSQLALPAPPATNGGPLSTPVKTSNPKIDLLSGDDYNSPTAENSLALVPVNVGEKQPLGDASQQKALALVDLYAPSNNAQSNHSVGQSSYPLHTQFQPQTNYQTALSQSQPNGSGAMLPRNQQPFYNKGSNTTWNGPMAQQQQTSSTIYGGGGGGGQTGGSLPPPPWEEMLSAETGQYSVGNTHQQVTTHSQPMPNGNYPQAPMGMYAQPILGGPQTTMNPQVLQNNQFIGFQPQPMQVGPSMGMYPQSAYMYPQHMYTNQVGGYGYGQQYGGYSQQQPNSQLLEQRMSEVSVNSSSYIGGSTPSYVHAPSVVGNGKKPLKQDDKFFGDLVDISKFKPTKTSGSSGTT